MLSRSTLRVLLWAASGALIAGCRVAPPGPHADSAASAPGTPAATEQDSGRDLSEAHAHYGAGIIHELNGEQELALREYYEAALNDPENEALALEISRRFLQANQPDKALDILTRATARSDASAALYARLGFVYSKLGKNGPAIEADRSAIRRQPRSLAGYQNLFLIYLQSRREKEALGVLDQAAGVPGADADFLTGLAELYANFGLQVPARREAANGKALAVLQRAEKLNPGDPQLRLRLADGFNILGKDDQAAQIYIDLLKHLPDLPYLRENIRAKLADIYLRGRDPKLAVEQLESVLRDDPTDVKAYCLLGSIAYGEGKFAQAVDYFAKALLLNPDFERVYYDLAGAQISGNQCREALDTLDRARRKFQQNFLLEYLSGMAYTRQKDYSNAISRFTAAEIVAQAAETNSLTGDFYFQFGAAWERQGDSAQAEKYFEKCLQLSPNDAAAQNYLGYMWADRGEKLERARELIEKAVKAEPKNAAYLDSLGWVLFKLHQPNAALDYILKAIQLSEEEDATLYDHLGDVYAALGQVEKARAAWSKSLAIEPNDQVRKKLEPAAR